jgi:hypothetical protein
MLKLQTKVSVVKMSQYSENQHSTVTQTTIKPIAFKQNRINFLQQKFGKSGSMLKNVRSAIKVVKKKGAIFISKKIPTEKTISK